MKKVRRYSEATLVSLLVTACGGGDNSSNMTPINSGSEKIDETSISSPILVESENTKSDSIISELKDPSVPEAPKQDETVSEVPVTPNDEKVEETVTPSTEPTVPEAPKSDETVSETPVTPNDEKAEETEEDPSDVATTPSEEKGEDTADTTTETTESPNVDVPITSTVSDHVLPPDYQPKDPLRVFDEADKFASRNGLIEKLRPQQQIAVNDENSVQKIGVIDTDFVDDDETFGNRLLLNQGLWRQAKGQKHDHGSQVAAVIAKYNSTSWIYGYTAESSGMTSPSNLHFEAAQERGIKIFNNSYGTAPSNDLVKEKGWKYLTDHRLHKQIAEMAENGSIFVWAVGNEGQLKGYGAQAVTEAHIPVAYKQAKKGWIAVASITGQWKSPYSSRVGEDAKNWGIATYGDHQVFGDRHVQGTSFAAPVVSAAVAKVWEKFPWMDNHLVTQTILSTADQLGTSNVTIGPNKDIGWGVLNLERALKGPARFDKRLLVEGEEFVVAKFDHRNYADQDRLTWSNNIAGDAGFKKQGTGSLYLTGYNTYTGDTVIDGGVLGLSGKLDNSNVTINTSGTLLAKNNEKPVEIGQSVTNNGSLDVYGKGLSIGGNYTADKDARTVIDIHTALLEIKGTADMQNSRILADVEKINDVPTQSESLRTILKAGNLVNYNNFYTVSDHIAPYIF
ncbi:S8 family serine peptidase [Glaesserella parasuis]|nr:S8 family serine peptidase [Glaesserella parasuis]MDP0480750.1 S8 family serine peptidase [Glaesserella parasuis]